MHCAKQLASLKQQHCICLNHSQDMKMKQLLLVDQMPTIFETFDELYQHDPSRRKEKERASESFTPQTQDDYLRSICHLAQPTFLCEIASRTPGSAHRSPKLKVNRRHQSDPASPVSSLRSSNKGKRLPSGTGGLSVDTIAIGVDRQHGAQGPASNVDPFAWLFGESCKENHQVSSQQGTQHRSPRDACPREDRPLASSHSQCFDRVALAENKTHEKCAKASLLNYCADLVKGKHAPSELYSHRKSPANRSSAVTASSWA